MGGNPVVQIGVAGGEAGTVDPNRFRPGAELEIVFVAHRQDEAEREGLALPQRPGIGADHDAMPAPIDDVEHFAMDIDSCPTDRPESGLRSVSHARRWP